MINKKKTLCGILGFSMLGITIHQGVSYPASYIYQEKKETKQIKEKKKEEKSTWVMIDDILLRVDKNIYEITIEKGDTFNKLLKYEEWRLEKHPDRYTALGRILEALNHKPIDIRTYVLHPGEKLVVPKLHTPRGIIRLRGIDIGFTVWGKYIYSDKVRKVPLKEVLDRIHRRGDYTNKDYNKEEQKQKKENVK